MTDDLIKREDAINALNECNDIRGYAYRQMHDALMEIPSVKPSDADCWGCKCERVELKQGEWNFIGANMFECTSCKVTYTTQQLNGLRNYSTDPYAPKYCPNCGAKMKGADDERQTT